MSTCLSAETLGRIAEGNSPVDPQDEQHVRGCAICAEQVAFLRRCIATGLNAVEEEVREVEALLSELWMERHSRWERIVTDPRFHRPSLVRRMLTLAFAARESDTRLALQYASTATAIVQLLPRTQRGIADLRFDAWRFHSTLLREMGQYYLCEEALAVAQEVAKQASDPELSKAIILLSRALLAIEPDVWQPEEGLTLLERAERLFEQRDRRRLLHTKTTRGMLKTRAGDANEAAAIFGEVLSVTSREEESAYADALRNYLWAAVHAGLAHDDMVAEIDELERADERRGAHLHVLRDRWIHGLLDLAARRLEQAIALLRDTMRGFEAKGHTEISIRAGIDAVRALLTAARDEESLELARDLASRATGLDQRQPSRRRALTAEAMSYLREAAQRRVLTADLVESVGAYLDKITHQRPVDFLPPMPLHEM